jgi:hypothetical protein
VLLLLVLLIAVLALVSLPSSSQAQYAAGSYIYFYSDPGKTIQVGSIYTNCAGQVVPWGYSTEYYTRWSVPCYNPNQD